VASASEDKTVNVWNTLTLTSIQEYKIHTDWVRSLDQIDSDTMVSGSKDETLRIWKISTGETLKTITANKWVNVVRVFSIECKQIVCGLESVINNLKIYNFETGSLNRTLSGHTNYVNSIEMLSGQFMASGGDDEKVIIWDIYSYTIKYTLTGHTSSVNCIVRLSSTLIASAHKEGRIIVWNWLTGGQIFTLTGHTKEIYSNSLDVYDDQTLISGSDDRTVKLWNITNGTLIRSINVTIQISALAMLKSGKLTEWENFFLLYYETLKGAISHLASPIYASFPQSTTTTSMQSSVPTSKLF
jgi:WD40 repeat protein